MISVCRVWYVNVVQDYSGAGTYGATEARYIEKEFIACLAGKWSDRRSTLLGEFAEIESLAQCRAP